MSMHNEASQIVPLKKAPAQPPDIEEDPSLARLLFCETLLEEYEGMEQPQLDPDELADIKASLREYREMYRVMDESQREHAEPAFEGEVLKRIYRLMNKAQKDNAENIRAWYADRYKALSDPIERADIVDCAVVSDVLGEINNLYRAFAKEADDIQDDAERERFIEGRVFETIHARAKNIATLQQATDNGSGPPAYESPMTGFEAEKLAGCTMRSALCLSGGGVRSATFNLGILQGLARHGLLDKFDYLSTVSGGGFIGGWLSAWIRRAGLPEVCKQLKEPPQTPLAPDPHPVEHLRIYSNYLSPQPGLLSADTWTLVASLVRNLLLNWLVFMPIFLALLLLPRIWTAIVLRSASHPDVAIPLSLVIGFIAAVVALSYVGLSLPSANKYTSQPPTARYKGGQGPFIKWCLIWLVVSAAALAVCLWSCYIPGRVPLSWWRYAAFAIALIVVPWIICVVKVTKKRKQEIEEEEEKKANTRKGRSNANFIAMVIAATILLLVAQIIVGYIASSVILLTLPLFHKYHYVYSIFSVPIVLLLMGLEGLLITGFTSRFSKDYDQEWWARAGAWVLIIAVAWSLVHTLVLFGPILILALEGTFNRLRSGVELTWTDLGKVFGTIGGIVSGIITLIGGFSAQTPANSKESQRSGGGMGAVILGLVTRLVAPIFFAFLIILLSIGTNWILISRPSQFISKAITGHTLTQPTSPLWGWHLNLIQQTPFRLLVVLAILITIIGVVMGRLISTNVFSLQYLWRNRIIRAYLGASHTDRRPDSFTGFDSFDNIQMHELWPQPDSKNSECTLREDRPEHDLPQQRLSRKLFHVLNMALNLTGGEKLQWQDRKAESFTVSPLHAGSYWLGYRRSSHYGGKDGISLGASIAISGAFVSPNMGFMMTSPIVRFLMAIFNVRFGWWFGNPGAAGDKTNIFERLLYAPAKMLGLEVMRPFRHKSPRLSVIPFLAEAFGATDDKSAYVYLSDGGHFENLGLYEMVLRRVRFIVVSDATTDPEYAFESLAMSIRQIRVDLGVPIEIPELAVVQPSQNLKNKYCAIGKIRYSCVDRDPHDPNTTDEDFDGVLIFIKPSLIGQEPRDVINYWQGRSSFPQEVITDQWFSEAQFESYRALGSYIIEAICDDKTGNMTLANFAQKTREHNRLNFRAFQEEISYLALEQEFKEGLQSFPVASYRTKVRRFMESLLR